MPETNKKTHPLRPKVKISSLAHRYIQKHHLDPQSILGTGPGKRIMSTDVLVYLEKLASSPEQESAVCIPETHSESTYYSTTIKASATALFSLKNYLNKHSLLANEYTLDDFILRAFVKAFFKTAHLEYPYNTLNDSFSINLILNDDVMHLLTNLNALPLLALSQQRQALSHQPSSNEVSLISYITTPTRPLQEWLTFKEMPQLLIMRPSPQNDSDKIELTLYYNAQILPAQKAQLLTKELKALLETPSLFLL